MSEGNKRDDVEMTALVGSKHCEPQEHTPEPRSEDEATLHETTEASDKQPLLASPSSPEREEKTKSWPASGIFAMFKRDPSDLQYQRLESKMENSSSTKLNSLVEEPPRWSWVQFVRFCGSGLLMSVAYLDPGNLEADIQVGVQAGYTLLWWYCICSVLFGFAYQCLAGRLGLVTGEDLAQHCGRRYPKGARILLWFLLELAIVGADIQETIGSALAIMILTGGAVPLWAGCILISLTAFGLLLLDRFGFRQLEAVFGVFIAVEAVAMGINFFSAQIPAKDLVVGLVVPKLDSRTLPVAVGALGALVMPYNIFFQSSIVNARPRDADTDDKKRMLLRYMRLENLLMLVLAFLINVFVVCLFAQGFYDPDAPDEVELGLESAGDHLAQRFGEAFRVLWAVGLLASGQVATIGLTYAGQLVMTGLLNVKVQAGPRMIATRLVALLPTVTLAVVFEASNTFDQVAQLLNIAQSLLLPFALLPVIHMTASREVMGDKFVSQKWVTAFTAAIAVAVLAVNGYLLFDTMNDMAAAGDGSTTAALYYTVFAVMSALYYMTVLYFAIGPDNLPGLCGWVKRSTRKAVAWARHHRLDCESMLEVHW
mmetsp:Transcript_11202/g.24121  ORF Transcript_11202/g.24121 Transcript_11202/m.24121 type:complete len:597 (+) Transcript_11202:151-1941(+)|eukprot:CAMPEP_0202906532 /NCGR_PEP_ID=MMETSP1392-20130828/39296_1 /ASSEMBLY_ACC=CAM_ASM_000868 /TAXON_ID=225041 /ORGANISM="Chlamydomonas chlamydogama, Strain SAG 11-48b" /LENGTH=596 /DNA_ID=CAMNT_0049595087 /DNA_START=101 /DNA_END=1891 /DNA_ORIENTATION=+